MTPVSRPPRHEAAELLTAFAAAARAAGVAVTADRTRAFLLGCSIIGADDLAGVYWTGRATLCAGADDLDRYDQVFASWFGGSATPRTAARDLAQRRTEASLQDRAQDDGSAGGASSRLRVAASTVEVLRSRDIAELSAAERDSLAVLFGSLRPRPPVRTSPRRRPTRRGEIDARRTLRECLRNAGEASTLRHRGRSARTRRVVLLLDVSGSMTPYADSLLRLAHVVTSADRARTEVFTMGTRLTRVTAAMRLRDADAALLAAGQTVPDWSGGTRLGEALRVFLDRWGQRGLARGAVVVVLSDGWERGNAVLLGEQMQRLQRLAHRVVWSNPHQGKPGYAPVQSGIVAALPFVDDFVAGHSMLAFDTVLEAVARA